MTARVRAAAAASLMGAAFNSGLGCGANAEPVAALIAVSPPMAYNDVASSLLIEGGPFRPTYDLDTMGGASMTDLSHFSARLVGAAGADAPAAPPISLDPVSWLSPGALAATLPTGIPAGTYDVDLTDPRGRHTVLSGAFRSLGADRDPPVVTMVAPGARAIVGAETTVVVTVTADDGPGLLASLRVTVSSAAGTLHDGPCTVPSAVQATLCHFEFTAPQPADDQDTIVIEAVALDGAGNSGSTLRTLPLAPRPSLTSLTPTVGPTAGGTMIDVRGTDFALWTDADGSRLLLDGVPLDDTAMVMVLSATEITAVLPGHDAGFALLQVATGDATTDPIYFEFVSPPIVKAITPTHGPVSGGTSIAVAGDHFRDGATIIQIDGRALARPKLVSPNRIEGIVPPGAAAGAVTVEAYDPIGGSDVRPIGAFTYDPPAADPADPADGGTDPGTDPMNGGGTP